MFALQIFGISGLLIPYSTKEVGIRFETLIYPYGFVVVFTIALNFLILLYLLYSFDMLGKEKTELEKQFVTIADVGLILVAILQTVDVYIWHYGLFGVNILIRALILLVLLRVNAAYQAVFGRRTVIVWSKLPFDLYLGYIQYLFVSALATSLVAWAAGGGLFSINARAVLLILVLTIMSMIVGLKNLNATSMFTVILFEAAIAGYHLLASPGYDGRFPEIYIAAILSIAALITSIIAVLIKRRRS